MTKEVWSPEKTAWCMKALQPKPITYNCMTKEMWSKEKTEWCMNNASWLQPKLEELETETFDCTTKELWSPKKVVFCNKQWHKQQQQKAVLAKLGHVEVL